MARRRLRVSDVARLTGLNRSTVTALAQQTATRIELPAIEKLCTLLQCPVGDLLEVVPDTLPNTLPTTLPGGRP